jgi:hypothetical protein
MHDKKVAEFQTPKADQREHRKEESAEEEQGETFGISQRRQFKSTDCHEKRNSGNGPELM